MARRWQQQYGAGLMKPKASRVADRYIDRQRVRVAGQHYKGSRVYEYQSGDGTIYWTFNKYRQTVVPHQNLQLQSRVGKHLINYLNELRLIGQQTQRLMEDPTPR